MKTILNKTLMLFIFSLVCWACEKDEERLIARTGVAPALTASQTTLDLKEADKTKDAITFSWSKADFGYNAAVRYTLQFDMKGNSFSKAKAVELTNGLMKTYTVAEINNMANEIGLPGFTASELEVRVKAAISEYYEPVYSNVLTIITTPYLSEPEYPTLYMVGDATEFNWDNTQGTAMFRDETDPFIYTYTGYLESGALKFLGYLGKWAPQFGNNGSGGIAFRATEADDDPGSFNVTTAGYYTVQVSLRNNTFTLTPFDAAGAKTFNSIGIIGGFNGWGDIEPMTKSALNPHTWTMDYTFTEDTEMKFRIAEGWQNNWGANTKGTENKIRFYGKGVPDGPNVNVTAGNYRIYFNDLDGSFVFVKK